MILSPNRHASFEFTRHDLSRKLERATGIELATFSLGIKITALYFHNLQNRSRKINVHALHTVHEVSDLRVAAGRLRDGVSVPI